MGHAATIVGAVRLPGTETFVLWPPRRTGLARVLLFLRLREQEDPLPLELSIVSEPDRPRRRQSLLSGGDHRELVVLELSFRIEALRQCLAGAPRVPLGQHVLWWANSIWSTLLGSVPVPDHWTGEVIGSRSPAIVTRRSIMTIHGAYEVDPEQPDTSALPYRLYLHKEAVEAVRRSLAENLVTELRVALPQVLAEWALHGRARGPRARAQFMLPIVRTALFVADQLILAAPGDPSIQRRLQEILISEGVAKSARPEARLVLVDRTLRPAWMRFGVRPLCERLSEATQVYAELLGQAERAQREWLSRMDHPGGELPRWFDRLLGPEGQTAKDFDLL